MIRSKRDAKKHAKASKRRYLKAQERLERDRRQAQQAAEALEQALDDLGLPADLVTEIEGRLRSPILRTFFEREGLTTEATNWLNVVIESHSHLNR